MENTHQAFIKQTQIDSADALDCRVYLAWLYSSYIITVSFFLEL